MDQELTFVKRELATNTFWLRSYGTIRKSFTSCQTSCLSRQSMQGKWQITRPIRLWGAACWDIQSHQVNTMQHQSNAPQEAFCFSSQSFQRPEHTYMHAAHENNWGDCCLLVLVLSGRCRLWEGPLNMETPVDTCLLLERSPVTFLSPSLSSFCAVGHGQLSPCLPLYLSRPLLPTLLLFILFLALIITGNHGVGGHLAHNYCLKNWNLAWHIVGTSIC